MKKMIYMILMVAVVGMVVACSPTTDSGLNSPQGSADTTKGGVDNKELLKVGVSQIVEHPSLDTIREGLYKGLADGGFVVGENLEIEYLNSQGSMENANAIANEFASKNYDVLVGITTPSAQALFNKVKEAPIVYSAVTDPVSAGLEGDNITGVSDMTPVDKQLELMLELLPETKRVGMIYNAGELNSEIQVTMAREALEGRGLTVEVKGITNSNEVSLALDALLGEIDVLYVQKDNTVASAFPVVVKKADAKNIPIIGAVKDYVDQGALATDGPSEFEIGYQTGEMVVRILKGESPKDIPSETVIRTKRDYNIETAKRYGIEIPVE